MGVKRPNAVALPKALQKSQPDSMILIYELRQMEEICSDLGGYLFGGTDVQRKAFIAHTSSRQHLSSSISHQRDRNLCFGA